MKFLVDRYDDAHQALKQQGLMASCLEVLALQAQDKPGTLQAVADCLARQNINLDNTSGFVANNRAILIIEVHELAKARAALQQDGLRVLTQEEMLNL